MITGCDIIKEKYSDTGRQELFSALYVKMQMFYRAVKLV
jgi:hypothetical protein